MKHRPQVWRGEYLTSVLAERYPDAESTIRECYSTDGVCLAAPGTHWVIQWPDNCVTCQHLSDASIHGPFQSEIEAIEFAGC